MVTSRSKARGTGGNDANLLIGSFDELYRLGGNDALYGGAGDDSEALSGLYGGAGNDYLQGDAGHDLLRGGTGNDALYGGLGSDSGVGGLEGGAGDDRLDGGEWVDTLTGGAGADPFVFGTESVVDTGRRTETDTARCRRATCWWTCRTRRRGRSGNGWTHARWAYGRSSTCCGTESSNTRNASGGWPPAGQHMSANRSSSSGMSTPCGDCTHGSWRTRGR